MGYPVRLELTCLGLLVNIYIYILTNKPTYILTNKSTPVSSSLTGCPIHKALCHICSLTKETDENIHMKMKWIILKKYISLSVPIHFEIYIYIYTPFIPFYTWL